MITDEYYLEIFANLERIEGYNWFAIPPDWPNREKIVEAIKKRIDMYGDFLFNSDYSEFRRVMPYSIDKSVNFVIEYRNHEYVVFNYDHLPKTNLKAYDKKKFNQALGRQ